MELLMYSYSIFKKMLVLAFIFASYSALSYQPVLPGVLAYNYTIETLEDASETSKVVENAIPSEDEPRETVPIVSAELAPESPEKLPVAAESPPAEPMPAPTSSAPITAAANMNEDLNTCPARFYQLELPSDGKLCQVFAAELPASMIFFVPKDPSQVIDFYQSKDINFSTKREVKGRFLMQSDDKNLTLIISEDGQGTQVDVLVRADKAA